MTGEMSRADVTRDAYPWHFALADALPGATVEPFDVYQGPYVYLPNHGRIFLSMEDDVFARWYSEAEHRVSDPFLLYGRTFNLATSTALALDLIAGGGVDPDRLAEHADAARLADIGEA